MKCPFCGTEIDNSAKFCYRCGSKMEDMLAKLAEDAGNTVQDTVDQLGSTASSYIDELGKTAQANADALQSGGSVTDDDYLEALKKAEETVQYGTSGIPKEETSSAASPYVYTYPETGSSGTTEGTYDASPVTPPVTSHSSKNNGKRLKNLLAALWSSGKLRRIVIGVIAAIVAIIIIANPFGGKKKKSDVSGNGYSNYSDLISDYINAMQNEDYAIAIKAYAPEVTKYYKENYSTDPSEIAYIADDAMQNGIYSNIKSWAEGDFLDWDVDEYYADTFADLGINAEAGKDVQVFYTFKNGDESDYYVFELIKESGKWFLLSVYY